MSRVGGLFMLSGRALSFIVIVFINLLPYD
jgi:hypothetical protein